MTVTPGSAAPVSSVIVPLMLPERTDCAPAAAGRNSSTRRSGSTVRTIRDQPREITDIVRSFFARETMTARGTAALYVRQVFQLAVAVADPFDRHAKLVE